MFYLPFWILIAVFLLLALITIKIKGFTVIDYHLIIMIIVISFFLDMVFCKWLGYYAYVVTHDLKAFYSLIFCVIGYPALGLIFIKFAPSTKLKLALYILGHTAALTILEIIVKPLKIIIYNEWKIIPYSPLIYLLSYIWIYFYYQVLKKHIIVREKGKPENS